MKSRCHLILPAITAIFVLLAGCGSEPSPSSASGSGGAVASSSSTGMGGEGVGGAGTGGSGGAGTGGSGGAGTGGSGGAGATGGGGGGGNDLSQLSDFFDGNALSADWMVFRPEVLNITVGNGALSLRLDQQALWFNDNRGPLVYKNVTGNFRVTARVRISKASNPAESPTSAVHLGGLMARDPQGEMPGASENYVFIVAGFDEMDLSIETKSTVNSASTYEGPAWPTSEAQLRLCRLGSKFYLYKRAIGAATYSLAKIYDRPDLPAKLQVGANVYSLSTPDLVARFDEIAFAPAATEVDCESSN